MQDTSAFKTIGLLVLLIIGLAFAYIVSYSPVPNMDLGIQESVSPTNSATVAPDDCSNLTDESSVQRCCSEWARDTMAVLPQCVGTWSWTQLGGCSFSCTVE